MEPNKESSVLKYIKSECLLNLWITAYYEKRIKKKQLINIDIKSTVKEIIKLTNTENQWIPLRISSGLLSGIVKVYYHKVDYLDNKCNMTLNRMQNFRKHFSNNVNSDTRIEDEYFERNIDRHQNNKFSIGMIDIDEINKDLDKICEDRIDHLEIVPLSQNKENDSSKQMLELSLELRNNQNGSEYAPIILDMEFEDFIDNQDDDVNMDTENCSKSPTLMDSNQRIEKIRGEAINFDEIIARGIEEITSNKENYMFGNDDKSEHLTDMNDGLYNRTSIDMYNSPQINENNRESIGGLSSTLEMFNYGNKSSISNESEGLFDNTNLEPIQLDCIDESNIEVVRKVNESLLNKSRLNRKRRRISEVEINLDSKLQLSLSYPNHKIDDYLRRIKNITLSYKNSNIDILSLNKTLPLRIKNDILSCLLNKELNYKIVDKRNKVKYNNLYYNINSIVGSQDSDNAVVENNFVQSFEELGENDENNSIRTPIRYARILEREADNNELIFTPWTKYVGSQERILRDSSLDDTSYSKKVEAFFSSREIKTMEYLNSKFYENKSSLCFSELVNESDVSKVAPIFVQILHLKSKSLINIKQEEPFGEIHIYPK